jgi:hypothetical protein
MPFNVGLVGGSSMTDVEGNQSNVNITVVAANPHTNRSGGVGGQQGKKDTYFMSWMSAIIRLLSEPSQHMELPPPSSPIPLPRRSLSKSQVYAQQLLSEQHGYPLWVPEPHGYSVTYRTKGVRIGDVGYVTQDGGFETLFNIRASAEDPINRRGVPENFERVYTREHDIIHTPYYLEPGNAVRSMSMQNDSEGTQISVAQHL